MDERDTVLAALMLLAGAGFLLTLYGIVAAFFRYALVPGNEPVTWHPLHLALFGPDPDRVVRGARRAFWSGLAMVVGAGALVALLPVESNGEGVKKRTGAVGVSRPADEPGATSLSRSESSG